MIYILISLGLLSFTILSQLWWFRSIKKKGTAPFFPFLAFIPGAAASAVSMWILIPSLQECVSMLWCYPLPLTGMGIYGVGGMCWLVLSASPMLGDESPSSIIIASVHRYGRRTERELFALFSDEQLIGKRLVDMEASGWISRVGHRYRISPLGKRIGVVIRWYRRLLRMELMG